MFTPAACAFSKTSWCCKLLSRQSYRCGSRNSSFAWHCYTGFRHNSRTSCPAFSARRRFRNNIPFCTRRTPRPTRSSICHFCTPDSRTFAMCTPWQSLWLSLWKKTRRFKQHNKNPIQQYTLLLSVYKIIMLYIVISVVLLYICYNYFRLVIRVRTTSSCKMLNWDNGLWNDPNCQTLNTAEPSGLNAVLEDVQYTRSNLFGR